MVTGKKLGYRSSVTQSDRGGGQGGNDLVCSSNNFGISEEFLVPVAILADYYGVKSVLSACIALITDNAGIPKVEKLRVAIKANAAELEVGINVQKRRQRCQTVERGRIRSVTEEIKQCSLTKPFWFKRKT